MSIIYSKRENSQRIREPLFQINRVKYRNSRSSHLENLETNLIKLDLSRILNELEEIDTSILNKITYFMGNTNNYTESIKLNDGISYEIIDIQVDLELDDPPQTVSIDVTNKLSGKLSRLFNKIQRLESGI